jgi:DUF4097 and DUF4098 domain-containing protein YvlB
MLWTLATLASLALTQQTDTSVAVQPGTRLRVDNFGGEVVIRAGTDNRVRVRADHGARDHVTLEPRAGTLTVKAESRRGPPQSVDFNITVPKWMAVSVSGVYTDATVEGTEADISLETVQGEVSSVGGKGFISLKSVEGSVTIRGARGRVEANSVNEGVDIQDVIGDIDVEAVNGDITLLGIDAQRVSATTVNGDIEYEGTVKDAGFYTFNSHNGDIDVSLPENANVAVTVSTYQGEFESWIPFIVERFSSKHRLDFKRGSGTARLEVESFQGDISLKKPGTVSRGQGRGEGRGEGRGKPKHEKNDHDEDN